MADYTIYIGNKNYSSWSLRAWLALKAAGPAFEEVLIPLYVPGSKPEILRHSPSGKAPALRHGVVTFWDSLAIAEYLAERFPAAGLWPAAVEARAVARAVSAEMHGGFLALRRHLPMNLRKRVPDRALTPEAEADVARVTGLWGECRRRFGETGPFLFGAFGIADAMYAPVVSRFRTYAVALDDAAQAYAEAVWAHPAMREWVAAAAAEPMQLEQFEL